MRLRHVFGIERADLFELRCRDLSGELRYLSMCKLLSGKLLSVLWCNQLHKLPDGSIPIGDRLNELCELSGRFLLGLDGCKLVKQLHQLSGWDFR